MTLKTTTRKFLLKQHRTETLISCIVVSKLKARQHLAVKIKGVYIPPFLMYTNKKGIIMALHMRDQLLKAVLAHAQGEIAKHKANVEVYLEHPAGIGEHSDITEAIQVEIDKIARYHDQIEVINHYFLKR